MPEPTGLTSDERIAAERAYLDEHLGRFSANLRRGATTRPEETAEVAEMRRNRSVTKKTAAAGAPGAGAGSMMFATGRPRDPLFYWKQNNLPYDTSKHEELKTIRQYCRLLYQSHPIVASCIDIYSKYPLLGMELTCKDEQIRQFHEDLFFSEEGLNYDKFLVDMGREYWISGEAWPFGSFNEILGVWEDEELLNPDDVEVERSPFLKDPRFLIRLPETLRNVIKNKQPAWEFAKLMEAYPELANYTDENALMPVSSILLRQLKFEADTFNKRGVPILMRAMRAIMQEEMLNAAMDAIADRLYTPLILVKLGASATDLGTNVPWIPTAGDLEDFNDSLDQALAGDFRVLTHHFATNIESVFGREVMPDMSGDFERNEDRILQSFGLSRTMLTGASSGETYAADALNRDLVSQLLTNFQKKIKSHYRQRALIVAEAQGHYDYDERNGKRYVKMEEILVIDEETGEERIEEQPKLLIPDLVMKTMNIQDEESERQFLESLRGAGVPISIKTRMRNLPIDLEDEIEQSRDEQVRLAVAEQETRKAQFSALRAAGLPIPQDLRTDFEPKANNTPGGAAEGSRVPVLGIDPTVVTPNLAPTQEDISADQTEGATDATGFAVAVDPTQAFPSVPPESSEQREDMPKAAALYRPETDVRTLYTSAAQMRDLTRTHQQEQKAAFEAYLQTLDKAVAKGIRQGTPDGKFADPAHVGLRRHASWVRSQRDIPMEDWGKPQQVLTEDPSED